VKRKIGPSGAPAAARVSELTEFVRVRRDMFAAYAEGLKTGDAHIIRNAGGIVTDDSLRSLIVSHHLLGTEEIMVINHTDCGLMHTSEQDLRTRIQNRTGTAAVSPSFFFAFQNIEENVRHQLQKLHTHPWIPKTVVIRGFVYDVTTGKLREIKHAPRPETERPELEQGLDPGK